MQKKFLWKGLPVRDGGWLDGGGKAESTEHHKKGGKGERSIVSRHGGWRGQVKKGRGGGDYAPVG